jgi:hypothetical protein
VCAYLHAQQRIHTVWWNVGCSGNQPGLARVRIVPIEIWTRVLLSGRRKDRSIVWDAVVASWRNASVDLGSGYEMSIYVPPLSAHEQDDCDCCRHDCLVGGSKFESTL